MMINPWFMLGIAIWSGALAFGADRFGYNRGTNAQKVAHQQQIDEVNIKLRVQKAQADTLYRSKVQELLEVTAARDSFKLALEKDYVKNREVTDNLERQLAGERLRFKSTQGRGNGDGGSGTGSTEGQTPGTPATTIVELPETLTRELRQIAVDADRLADDYRLCYAYVTETPVAE